MTKHIIPGAQYDAQHRLISMPRNHRHGVRYARDGSIVDAQTGETNKNVADDVMAYLKAAKVSDDILSVVAGMLGVTELAGDEPLDKVTGIGDEPPDFPGKPKPGGEQVPLKTQEGNPPLGTKISGDSMLVRAVNARVATASRTANEFASRFPGADRIGRHW